MWRHTDRRVYFSAHLIDLWLEPVAENRVAHVADTELVFVGAEVAASVAWRSCQFVWIDCPCGFHSVHQQQVVAERIDEDAIADALHLVRTEIAIAEHRTGDRVHRSDPLHCHGLTVMLAESRDPRLSFRVVFFFRFHSARRGW